MNEAAKIIGGALVGAVVAWTGHTLTFMGRIDAVERTLIRIESRLDTINPQTTKATP